VAANGLDLRVGEIVYFALERDVLKANRLLIKFAETSAS